MYDINIKNVKKGRSFFYIFLVLGIVFLLIFGGFFTLNAIKVNSLDSKVLSSSVDVQSHIDNEGYTMYSPVYHYEVNGRKYSCKSVSSSNNPGTKNKNVYYDSKNPSNCMTQDSKFFNYIILIFLIIPIIFIWIGVVNIRKINKRVKAILELNYTGKLIKNLPYRLENTNMTVNDVPIKRPVVDYTLSSGTHVTLYGDARHDGKQWDEDGMVDLLIDETNPDNYYIDFEINYLSGDYEQQYSEHDNMR